MGMPWPSTLPMPLLDGYSTAPGVEVARTDMEAGEARVRRRSVSAPDTIKLAWLLDAAQMKIFRAYWDIELAAGASWCDMNVDVGDGIEQKSVRVIGQYQAAMLSPSRWKVSCEAEVRKLRSSVFDYLNLMGLPSLDLDFAGTQSLSPVITSARQPRPVVSFARASTATYIGADGLLKIAAESEPRFYYDPITHVCKGLLIEESRANLFLYSEQFDNAVWNKGGNTITANAAAAPDGTTTADKYTPNNGQAATWMPQFVSGQAAGTFTVSAFLKDAGGGYANLYFYTAEHGDNWCRINLSTGALDSTVGPVTKTLQIQQLINGYYRCSMTFTTTGMTSFQAGIRHSGWTGDGTKGFYMWGLQIEAGSFPTSYIPTTSSSVSRAWEVCSLSGSNFSSWYRADEGGLVVDRIPARYPLVAEYDPVLISDGTFNNVIDQRVVGGTTQSCDSYLVASGTIYVDSPNVAAAAGVEHKQAMTFNAASHADCLDGGTVNSDSTLVIPSVNQMRIGSAGAGVFKRVRFFPRRLTNAELQALTA